MACILNSLNKKLVIIVIIVLSYCLHQDNPGLNANHANIKDLQLQQGSPGDRVSIIFTLKNQVGNLARALQVFQELGINVLHLELSPLENATNQVWMKSLRNFDGYENV